MCHTPKSDMYHHYEARTYFSYIVREEKKPTLLRQHPSSPKIGLVVLL